MQSTELHLHTEYSILDGLNNAEEYMRRASEIGMTHLAITDHGTLAGHRAFQRAAKEAGIKPLLGVEAYISETDRFDRRAKATRQDGTNVYNHMGLIAMNQNGLNNLNKLSSIAWEEGFYHKPRIDMELLEEYNEDIIVLSGCISGLIAKSLENGLDEQANRYAAELKRIFGERFFIEIQGHNPENLNKQLMSIASKHNVLPVVTSDCHYAREEDLWIQDAMLILSTNPKKAKDIDFSKSQQMDFMERYNYLYPDRTMTFQEYQIFLRSYEQHRALLEKHGIGEEPIQNTMVVANMIGEYEYHEGLSLLPEPKNASSKDILRAAVERGMVERGLAGIPEYEERKEEELKIISDLNFDSYFLVLKDGIDFAKENDILIGPGRGSGAGSLVNYCIGATGIDPIKHNLLFFRFLNPERVAMPDVDTDIDATRRSEVKEHYAHKFKNVASIATFGRFKGKSSIKDAARVFCVPYADVERALKGADWMPPLDWWEEWEATERYVEFNRKYPEVIKLARVLYMRLKSQGMHAGGLVVANDDISKFAPMQTSIDSSDPLKRRIPMIAYDMEEAEKVGFVKYDFLGLSALTIIKNTLESIKQRKGIDIDLYEIPMDDENVYRELSEGNTRGCFQVDATPYTNLLVKMGGVKNFDELVASNALVRPGAAKSSTGESFVKRKNNLEDIKSVHPDMDSFTKDTYFKILYQEQVMLTMTELAGMSMGDADAVRKIIGKKRDVSEFDAYKSRFVEGASKKVDKKVAEGLWKDFEAHAGYSFNKCAYYGTRVQMADGTAKTMGQLHKMHQRGETIDVLAMWSDGGIRPHRVKNVVATGKKKLFHVRTEGKRSIQITEDHRLLTTDGYKPLSAMSVGDELIVTDKFVSENMRNARSNSMKSLRASSIGKEMDARAADRMRAYQATLTFEDRSAHQKSMTHDRMPNMRAAQAAWKAKWDNDVEWRKDFMRKTLAAPRGYRTGSGYGNSGFAKDGKTWCASTPERELCDWLIDNEIEFEAHKVLDSGRMCDFYVDGLYIEMDGMDREFAYFEEKYAGGIPFIVVTPEDYKEVLSGVFKVMHARNGDKIISIEESYYNINGNNYTMDIEMEEGGPKNFITASGIVSHNSHAVAYSTVTYWTAWLKYNYPADYMMSLLKDEKDTDKRLEFLMEAKRLGLKVKLPHVNKSNQYFEIQEENGEEFLRFGLSDVKYVGPAAAKKIIESRPYESYAQLKEISEQKYSGISSRCLEYLNKVGGAAFPDNPLTGNERDNLFEVLSIPAFQNKDISPKVKAKLRTLDEFESDEVFLTMGLIRGIKTGAGWTRLEIVDETGTAGCFVNSGDNYEVGETHIFLVANNGILTSINLAEYDSSDSYIKELLEGNPTEDIPNGMLKTVAFAPRLTKAKKKMADIVFIDHEGKFIHALCWPTQFLTGFVKAKPGAVVDVVLKEIDGGHAISYFL